MNCRCADFIGWHVLVVGLAPDSENKETGNDKEVKANADKDEEPEDDPKLVGDGQQEDGDQSVQYLGRERGVRVHLEHGQEPGGVKMSDLRRYPVHYGEVVMGS